MRRLTTDAGEALIGRVLDAEQVRAVRTSFGLDGDFAMTGEEAFEAVMGRGTALALANGWRLARRRIMGADRVEIEGPVDGDTDALKRMGCTVEIVSWRARAFAPRRAGARPHPRTLAARRVSPACAIRIAGPPCFGGAGASATIPRSDATPGARAAGPPAAATAPRPRRPLR